MAKWVKTPYFFSIVVVWLFFMMSNEENQYGTLGLCRWSKNTYVNKRYESPVSHESPKSNGLEHVIWEALGHNAWQLILPVVSILFSRLWQVARHDRCFYLLSFWHVTFHFLTSRVLHAEQEISALSEPGLTMTVEDSYNSTYLFVLCYDTDYYLVFLSLYFVSPFLKASHYIFFFEFYFLFD